MDLRQKAILIQGAGHQREFNRLCSLYKIERMANKPNVFPYYEMMFRTSKGYASIRNYDLDTEPYSVSYYKYSVITMSQFKKILEENFE